MSKQYMYVTHLELITLVKMIYSCLTESEIHFLANLQGFDSILEFLSYSRLFCVGRKF